MSRSAASGVNAGTAPVKVPRKRRSPRKAAEAGEGQADEAPAAQSLTDQQTAATVGLTQDLREVVRPSAPDNVPADMPEQAAPPQMHPHHPGQPSANEGVAQAGDGSVAAGESDVARKRSRNRRWGRRGNAERPAGAGPA